jgi:hypothetical protein
MHIELAMNNSMNATIEMTLTELLYRTSLYLILYPANTQSEFPAVTEFLEYIDQSVRLAQD